MNKSNSVGVLDTGIGGLTVLKEAASLMPNENYIYLGDNACGRSGDKSDRLIIEQALKGARFLINKNIKALVIAGNSISSAAIDEIRKISEMPVVDLIDAGVKAVFETGKPKRIGVIGDEAVIRNNTYSVRLKNVNSKVKVFEKAVPLLIPLAFEAPASKAALITAKEYIGVLAEKNIDTLILGSCYLPPIAGIIKKAAGRNVNIINPAVSAAQILKNYLEGRGLRSQSVHIGYSGYYMTDLTENIKSKAESFAGMKIDIINEAVIL